MSSNHTILKNFFLLGVVLGGLYHWIRGSSWSRFFGDIVPVGQVLLLLMYVFGIFHKINTGFLNPEVSCAVALWRVMPLPLRLLDGPIVHHLTIYGTFVVEGVIILLLLLPRLRQWGIVAGMGFHMLLALSGFAMYPAFSSLSLALHTLFLSPAAAERVVASALFRRVLDVLNSRTGWLLLLLAFGLIAGAAFLRAYSAVGLFWLAIVAPPALTILLHGRRSVGDASSAPILWPRLRFLRMGRPDLLPQLHHAVSPPRLSGPSGACSTVRKYAQRRLRKRCRGWRTRGFFGSTAHRGGPLTCPVLLQRAPA